MAEMRRERLEFGVTPCCALPVLVKLDREIGKAGYVFIERPPG